MKHIALIAFNLLSFSLHAQTLYMKSGAFTPVENVKSIQDFENWTNYQYSDKTYCLLQFAKSISELERQTISKLPPESSFMIIFHNGHFLLQCQNHSI